MKDKKNLPFVIEPEDSKKDNKPAKKKTGIEKQREFIALVFEKNPVGRPRFYKTKEELEEEIQNYFVYCYDESIKLTISGLVLYCGFSDRKSFYAYEQHPEFSHTIKKARALITMHYEGLLQEAFPQGAVFALKNLGWNAEEQIETTVKKKTRFIIGGSASDEDNAETTPYEELE